MFPDYLFLMTMISPKTLSSLENTVLSRIFNHLMCKQTNKEKKILAAKIQQNSHRFCESYNYQSNVLTETVPWKQLYE